jgi:hypothetical protein
MGLTLSQQLTERGERLPSGFDFVNVNVADWPQDHQTNTKKALQPERSQGRIEFA